MDKNKLEKYYILDDLDRKDVCLLLNISRAELCILLDYYKIKKDISIRMRKTRRRQLANLTPEKGLEIKKKELATKAAKSEEEKQYIKKKELDTKNRLKKENPKKYREVQEKRNKTHSLTLKQKPDIFWKNRYSKFYISIQKTLETSTLKCQETKRTNNSFNKSREEEYVAEILSSKYKILRQYKSSVYPFYCDFYIPEINLFIEINGHWTHGKHPFNAKDENDLKLLSVIKNKQKTYLSKSGNEKKNMYYVFEHVWTELDVNKLNYAKNSGLDYIVIYNINKINLVLYKNKGVNIIDMSKI